MATDTTFPEARGAITRALAAYAAQSRYDALPDRVRTETARTFVNWMGCALGGCREPAVNIAAAAVADAGAAPQATIIGRHERADVAGAAFVNCLSSSVLAFDDTHLATVTHPTGPVAAALLALSEKTPVSGQEFVNALALGIEIECRMSNVLLLPPAQANLGLYITGVTGPIGVAAAIGRVLGFDEQRMAWAIGLGAAQGCGFRATHGSMAGHVVPALAARGGVWAAMLAAQGFSCSENALEADNGFFNEFSRGADFLRAIEGLGQRFELLANAYKPYPSGIVVHPTIDTCREIADMAGADGRIDRIRLTVHPLAVALADRRSPATPTEAQISLQHWAAAVLLGRPAGLEVLRQECIDDAGIAALRLRVEVVADPGLGREAAIAEVTLAGGAALRAHVTEARGSGRRPMTDDELDAKFIAQASGVLPQRAADRLMRLCRGVASLDDVGREIAAGLLA